MLNTKQEIEETFKAMQGKDVAFYDTVDLGVWFRQNSAFVSDGAERYNILSISINNTRGICTK